jgi:DNA-binding Lrp family transcriptional regulator
MHNATFQSSVEGLEGSEILREYGFLRGNGKFFTSLKNWNKRKNERLSMKRLKAVDYGLLWELIKDSRRSDRQLARALGTSQPTVTRKRAIIEKSFIDGYTAIPKWDKIGFQLVVFTLVKHKIKYTAPEERRISLKKVGEWMMKQPNVVFALEGQGFGWDGVCVSFHKSYSDFVDFITRHNSELSDFLIETQSFIADLTPAAIVKPFHLKYLEKTK